MADQPSSIDSILSTAVEIGSEDRRAAYLDDVCGDDVKLRAQVEKLLRAHFRAGSFLECPIAGTRPEEILDALTDPEGLPAAISPTPGEISLDFLQPCDVPGRLGKLGPYEVIGTIGRGGMGVVLQAYDPKLSRVAAIKVLAPEFAAIPTARKRFLREARAAAAVNHPHVVSIHAVEEAANPPYLVMEYVDGQSLQYKIERDGMLTLEEVLRIGSQIAAGLAAAHHQGLIHRDIKPDNILLENGVERVRITDFGLARAVDDANITHIGEVAGTPNFMSPEQAQGHALDHRSDLFSLGSLLYTMCTGRSPFRAATTVAVLRRVCDDVPRPIREVNPEIPAELVAIVDRLLAKDPNQRFQTAEEVADLLSLHLAYVQCPIGNPRPGPLGVTPDMSAQTISRDKPSLPPHSLSRHRHWLVAGLVLAAVLTGLGMTEATGVTRFTVYVIRVMTGEGTLVIRVDDPAVSVTIEGQDIVITGAGPKEVRLKPGKYRLHANKNGKPVPIDQELVTITRGGRELINVTLEPSAIEAKTAEAETAHPIDSVPWTDLLPADAPSPAVAPFDEATAKEHQQAWADYLGMPVKQENSLGMEFMLIPPGEFLMGSRQEEIDELLMNSGAPECWLHQFPCEGPRHRIRITQPLYLAVFEVTQQQYLQVMGTNPSHFVRGKEGNEKASDTLTHQLPVDNVSWFDAVSFCNKLSGLEKRQPCYAIEGKQIAVIEGTGYRLPTEAEWEYACRSGSARKYCFGDSQAELGSYAWYSANAKGTPHPVGEKLPNGFGLYDVHGNTWEWCQDWWDGDYYINSPVDDPQGPTQGFNRVYRGGGWFFPAVLSRAAYRDKYEPWQHSYSIGFRAVAVLELIPKPLTPSSSPSKRGEGSQF